jgi:hypothetical protein
VWLRIALTEAAVRTEGTYLAAYHTQIHGRRGAPKAIGATPPRHPHRLRPHIVHDKVPYQGLGWAGLK